MLRRLFNFYLNSSIHVALAAFALTWVTLVQFQIEYDENSLYFVFFATITAYNFVKYFGVAKFHHRRLATWLKVIQLFSLLAFVAMCYYLIQLEYNTLILISVLGIITFLYAIPLIPRRILYDEHQNLREIGGLKVYVIGFVWTFTTVILPLINNGIPIGVDVVITGFQRLIFILVVMLPFEIGDMKYDSIKLATIPQKIGVKRSKIIGVLLLMVFILLEFFKEELKQEVLLSTLTITFVTVLFLIFSEKNQSKYYSAFWVEGIPVLWLILLLVFG